MIKAGLVAGLPAVKCLDGVVYLSGTLASLEAKKTAEDAAWSVPGVEQVVSKVQVATACPRTDEELLSDVQVALSRQLGSGSRRVHPVVRKGIVYLRGRVESEHQKVLTENAVAWTPCVAEVVNQLVVASGPPD